MLSNRSVIQSDLVSVWIISIVACMCSNARYQCTVARLECLGRPQVETVVSCLQVMWAWDLGFKLRLSHPMWNSLTVSVCLSEYVVEVWSDASETWETGTRDLCTYSKHSPSSIPRHTLLTNSMDTQYNAVPMMVCMYLQFSMIHLCVYACCHCAIRWCHRGSLLRSR